MSTTPIWSSNLNVSLILFALNSLKLSAQSPPCIRKAFPMAASASLSSKLRASPANTSGGKLSKVFTTPSSLSWSGYLGCCKAVFNPQLLGVQSCAAPPDSLVAGASRLLLTGSAAWTAFTTMLLLPTDITLPVFALSIARLCVLTKASSLPDLTRPDCNPGASKARLAIAIARSPKLQNSKTKPWKCREYQFPKDC